MLCTLVFLQSMYVLKKASGNLMLQYYFVHNSILSKLSLNKYYLKAYFFKLL